MINNPLPVDDDQIEIPASGKPAPKPEKQGHLRVLSNGAVYDTRIGRIVNSKNVTTKITSENAVAMQSQRVEMKRQALARAANAVAAQGGGVDGREMQGDWAFVEAIGEAMTMKALTVNDPKAVDAARFLFQETGIAEVRASPGEAVTDALDHVHGIVHEIADALRDAIRANLHDTIGIEPSNE